MSVDIIPRVSNYDCPLVELDAKAHEESEEAKKRPHVQDEYTGTWTRGEQLWSTDWRQLHQFKNVIKKNIEKKKYHRRRLKVKAWHKILKSW